MYILQNILTVAFVLGALWFLYKKFIAKDSKKSCGGDNCAC